MQLSYFLAMAASIATATAVPSLQKRALSCPASNNTVYTTLNGNQYTIECGLDRVGADYAMAYTANLEACLLACSLNPICLDVSYNPGNVVGPCYMKTAINPASNNNNIIGARLGTGSLSTSSSSTSSSKTTTSTASTSSASSQSSTSTTASSSTQSSTSTTASSSTQSSTSTTASSSTQSSTSSGAAGNTVSSVVSVVSSAVSAAATAVQTCGASVSAIAEYPHMVIRVSKNNPTQGFSQVWNGTMNSDIDSIFNFDIKSSYAGKSCTLFFLPPTSDQLASAGFPWGTSGTGSLTVSRLSSWVSDNVALTALPLQTPVGTIGSFTPGSNAIVYSTFCPAGDRMSFRFTATGSFALDYYQYVLPYSIGVYMSVC